LIRNRKISKTIQTNNEGWGFYGTCLVNGLNAQKEWKKAIKTLVKDKGLSQEQARDLLDSKWGRHTANELTGGQSLKLQLENWHSYFTKSLLDIGYQAP